MTPIPYPFLTLPTPLGRKPRARFFSAGGAMRLLRASKTILGLAQKSLLVFASRLHAIFGRSSIAKSSP